MRRLALILIVVAGLVLVVGRPVAWVEAALVVTDVAAGGQPTLWQRLTATPRERPARWLDGEGDLYLPADEPRAALVLVPGAAVLGRDEPRLQALARTLARARFAVLVPELPEVRRLALSRRDGERVASAMRQLAAWQPDRPLGLAAVSYAVAPAVIAALEDDIAPRLAFLLGIGGYRDAEAVIRFMTTGTFRVTGDPREHRRAPGAYGRWAFLLANAGRLENRADAILLEEIARRRFRDPSADVARYATSLGPEGRSVLDLVENTDPGAVAHLIAALPEGVRREIDGLNLVLYDLTRLRGRLVLVHGRGDPLVPYSESENLAAAASGARVSLFLVDDLGHVEFDAVTLANAWSMWRAALAVLDERR